MNISITPELEHFVHTKVSSGMYQSASELVREALRLLVERDALQQRRIEAMDDFIQRGLDDSELGNLVSPEHLWAEMDAIIENAAHKHG